MAGLSKWGAGSERLAVGAQAQNEGLQQTKSLADVMKTSPAMHSNKVKLNILAKLLQV